MCVGSLWSRCGQWSSTSARKLSDEVDLVGFLDEAANRFQLFERQLFVPRQWLGRLSRFGLIATPKTLSLLRRSQLCYRVAPLDHPRARCRNVMRLSGLDCEMQGGRPSAGPICYPLQCSFYAGHGLHFLSLKWLYNSQDGGRDWAMAFDLERFLSSVNGGRTLVTHRTGETVYSQGDRCDVVFYVRSGKCKVSVISDQGKEAIVALHAKGDFFGEGSLTGQPLRLATVMAMTDLELLRFDLASMRRALQEEPFSELFIAHLLARKPASCC